MANITPLLTLLPPPNPLDSLYVPASEQSAQRLMDATAALAVMCVVCPLRSSLLSVQRVKERRAICNGYFDGVTMPVCPKNQPARRRQARGERPVWCRKWRLKLEGEG